MKQTATQQFESECGRAKIIVHNDMPIGVFHDFLLEIKGHMVDKMVAAQKEQKEVAEKQKEEEKQNEVAE